MAQIQAVMVVLALSLTIMTSQANANTGDTVTIHDVKINNQQINDVATGNPSVAVTNCAEFVIGAAPNGTTYTNFKVEPIDNTQPAKIQALENNVNCGVGKTNATTHDKLRLLNARVIPMNQNALEFILEFSADFGNVPDGTVTYGGNMQGAFKPPGACTGCESHFFTWVLNQGTETPLAEAPSVNPPLGSFNVAVPSKNIQDVIGARTHRGFVKFKFPSTNKTVEVRGTDRFESTTTRKAKRPSSRKAD